jgi:hypothetical protein
MLTRHYVTIQFAGALIPRLWETSIALILLVYPRKA